MCCILLVLGTTEDPLFGQRFQNSQGSQRRCAFDSSQELSARETSKCGALDNAAESATRCPLPVLGEELPQSESESTKRKLRCGKEEAEEQTSQRTTISVGIQTDEVRSKTNSSSPVTPPIEGRNTTTRAEVKELLTLSEISRLCHSGVDPIKGRIAETASSVLVCGNLWKQEQPLEGATNENMCPALEQQAAWMGWENGGLESNEALESTVKSGAGSQSCDQLSVECEEKSGGDRGAPKAGKESISSSSCPRCCSRFEEMERLKERLEQTESTVIWQSLMIRLYQMNT